MPSPPPLDSIPPLVPVPISVPAGNGAPISPSAKPDVDDLFATLFAPPPDLPLPLGSSPSPSLSPSLSLPVTSTSTSLFSPPPSSSSSSSEHAHSRLHSISTASSTDSDFGDFVSVPAFEDPLTQPATAPAPVPVPSSSLSSSSSTSISSSSTETSPSNPDLPSWRRLSLSGASAQFFFAEARAATARNRKGFLAELLEHEDDPMYWHKREQQHPSSSPSSSSRPASAIQSGATTPQPRQAPQPQPPPEPELTTRTDFTVPKVIINGDNSDDGILGGELSDEPPPVEMNVGMRVGMGVDVDADVTNVTVEPLMEALSEAVSDNTFAVSAIPLVTRHHQHHLAKTTRDRAESDSIIIAPSSTSTSTRRRPGVHPPSPITRSPSLPPSSPPSRPSPPVLTRTESISTFMSGSGSGSGLGSGSGSGSGSAGAGLGLVGGGSWSGSSSLPSRWVTSFLTYRGPPLPLSQAPTTAPGIPPHSSIPKRSVTDITHGSPFAATPFVPASGAPGFDGDRKWNKKGFEVTGDDGGGGGGALDDRRAVQLLGRKESTRVVLETALANTLRSHLPARARLPRSWTLLFSLDQHGISLQTLYARCSAATSSSSTATTTTTTSATPSHSSGALLVVCDAEETRFGAWIADGIREGHGSYTGSGESFLWKVHEDGVKVFKWTGKNDYVALCEPESISFGGGDGHYGLYLDETLYEGSSARCLTFNNEPLCAFSQSQSQSKVGGGGGIGTVRFECVGLEVWGVSS